MLIHDTNKDQSSQYLDQMQALLDEMIARGYNTKNIGGLIRDANVLQSIKKYDAVLLNYNKIKEIYDLANLASIKISEITNLINAAGIEGIATPNAKRLLSLANLAFGRGEYALALERLGEAELTLSVETKGEFNWFVFLQNNFYQVMGFIIAVIIGLYLVYLLVHYLLIKRKIKSLDAEADLLLLLIKGAQKNCFVSNKMSIGEYYDALEQFEERMSRVSEGIIEYKSKKGNLFKLSPNTKRLSKEKAEILTLVRETQKDYFDKGTIEARIYETRVKSLTKRLSEIEEAIVVNRVIRTERKTKGVKKLFWRVFYKLFK
ncbi:MAG: hypothetical protein HN878_01475 [Candidatus Diapherotrites archaeon]|nr:hypothetical protein [Candidatus Diapherotrites archaeon]